MARHTGTGAWWRIDAWPMGACCNAMCLYLGEINDTHAHAWRRSIEVLDEREHAPRTVALFPEDRIDECAMDASVVRLRLSQLRLCKHRV